MTDRTDPSWHQAAERRAVAHVARRLEDGELFVETTRGRRAVAPADARIERSDAALDLKRAMSDAGRPDFDLQRRMPVGERLDATLTARRWGLFRRTVGRVRVVSVPPTAALLAGESPPPLTAGDVRRAVGDDSGKSGVPTTTVVVSSAGFDAAARALASGGSDGILILLEPDDAGGWAVHAPASERDSAALLDPEPDPDKRRRVREAVDVMSADLLTDGVSAAKVAGRSRLPLELVESELRAMAGASSGLRARPIDGRVVLYRESAAASGASNGGAAVPLIDRMRSLFGRSGETERKIAFLAERRAALGQQKDRAYEDVGALEAREAALREEFRATDNPIARRRVTGQLVQLRKDIDRRQQMVSVLNQQINVVGTHLHHLQLVKQGTGANLPAGEELAADAAAAEEVLATLQADSELADALGGVGATGLNEEERALYEELEREAAADPPAATEGRIGRERVPSAPAATPGESMPSRAARPSTRAEPETG